MHHVMKNFSDITAIETVNALSIELNYRFHGNCLATVCINDTWYVELGHGVIPVNLFDPISLTVTIIDFEEGTSGIEIEKFNVNGIEILPKYQHLSSSKKCYIDQYDTWRFDIPAPFYVWYHKISGQGWIA